MGRPEQVANFYFMLVNEKRSMPRYVQVERDKE